MELKELTTDYLFDYLIPPFINIEGELYHLNVFKSKNGVTICYESDLRDGESASMGATVRKGETLREVCIKAATWLFEFGYVPYMPYGYKSRYETISNIKIEHSRGFDN